MPKLTNFTAITQEGDTCPDCGGIFTYAYEGVYICDLCGKMSNT